MKVKSPVFTLQTSLWGGTCLQHLPLVAGVGLWGVLCRTGTSVGCPSGRGNQSTAEWLHQHHQKMGSEKHTQKNIFPQREAYERWNDILMQAMNMQTLVIWSASGRTLGVTLSSILTCSRTSSGILLSTAGLMLLNYNWKTRINPITVTYTQVICIIAVMYSIVYQYIKSTLV